MQFETVSLKIERTTDPEEITRLFEKYGRIRQPYYHLREKLESNFLEEIEKVQDFLRKNTSVREFNISQIKAALDICLKKALIDAAVERLFSKGECDLKIVIETDVDIFSRKNVKYVTIEAYLLLLREEVYDASYVNVRQAIQKLEELKKKI